MSYNNTFVPVLCHIQYRYDGCFQNASSCVSLCFLCSFSDILIVDLKIHQVEA